MYKLKLKSHFDSAHRLPWHDGKCKNLHGHRWEVEIRIETEKLDPNDVVIDFGILKDLLPDHMNLNEIIPNPTAENISKHLYDKIVRLFEEKPSSIEVEVWEGPKASIVYYDDED